MRAGKAPMRFPITRKQFVSYLREWPNSPVGGCRNSIGCPVAVAIRQRHQWTDLIAVYPTETRVDNKMWPNPPWVRSITEAIDVLDVANQGKTFSGVYPTGDEVLALMPESWKR